MHHFGVSNISNTVHKYGFAIAFGPNLTPLLAYKVFDPVCSHRHGSHDISSSIYAPRRAMRGIYPSHYE